MDASPFKMNKLIIMFLYVAFLDIPLAQCAVPGTFFWKPRLGLDLSIPTTEATKKEGNKPTKENIRNGLVVLVDGYNAGVSILCLAYGATNTNAYPHLNPLSAPFHTNAYRWALRYISLLPLWLKGNTGNFFEAHKVWRKRYYFMDEFVPSWLRTALFYVKKEDWKKEEQDYKKFRKYAEPAFFKHYRHPSKVFNDFKSQYTVETMDQQGVTSSHSK